MALTAEQKAALDSLKTEQAATASTKARMDNYTIVKPDDVAVGEALISSGVYMDTVEVTMQDGGTFESLVFGVYDDAGEPAVLRLTAYTILRQKLADEGVVPGTMVTISHNGKKPSKRNPAQNYWDWSVTNHGDARKIAEQLNLPLPEAPTLLEG